MIPSSKLRKPRIRIPGMTGIRIGTMWSRMPVVIGMRIITTLESKTWIILGNGSVFQAMIMFGPPWSMTIGLRTGPAVGFGKPIGVGHGVLMSLGVGLPTIMGAGFPIKATGIGGLDRATPITVRCGRPLMFRLLASVLADRTGILDLASDTTLLAGCLWAREIIAIRGGGSGIPTMV